MIDAFNQNLFSLTEMTAAINNMPYTPSQIAGLGLFDEDSISTTTASIEIQNGVLYLVPVVPRGAPGYTPPRDGRGTLVFTVPHLPQSQGLMADQVQNVRTFGSDNGAATIEGKRDRVLARMRRANDYTIEAHSVAAIMGQLYDANGQVVNLFTYFGVTQQVIDLQLGTATTRLRPKALEIAEKIEDSLAGVDYTGAVVLCGRNKWRQLVDQASIRETYLNQIQAAEMRGGVMGAFEFGDMTWMRYRGTAAVKIPDDEAYVVPRGVADMFVRRFAPANYNETVNTPGLPYYAKAEELRFGKGWEVEAQSNVLSLNTRPGAVIKLI